MNAPVWIPIADGLPDTDRAVRVRYDQYEGKPNAERYSWCRQDFPRHFKEIIGTYHVVAWRELLPGECDPFPMRGAV